MTEDEISYKIIGAALEVHKEIGPGVFESAYENPLVYELNKSKLFVQQQVIKPLIYKGIKMDCAYKVDLIVENKIIVELKSVETLLPIHFAQVLTYLRLSDIKLGLLINFKNIKLKDGIHRIVNNLY